MYGTSDDLKAYFLVDWLELLHNKMITT
jgi:hypothetical protein